MENSSNNPINTIFSNSNSSESNSDKDKEITELNKMISLQKMEISNLKEQLYKSQKLINDLNKQKNDSLILLNTSNNQINHLKSLINQKEEEIIKLKNLLNNNNNFDNKIINNNKQLYSKNIDGCINFTSVDQKISFAIPCSSDSIFAELEERLYQEYPEYRETNNSFLANECEVLRFKTIKENNIGNGRPVVLVPYYSE